MNDLGNGKVCRVCGKWKLYSEYNRAPKNKDGMRTDCKACQQDYLRQYYQKNIDKIKQSAADWRTNNPERKKELDRKYREDNATKIADYKKFWYEKNQESLRVYRKRKYQEHLANNPNYIKEQYQSNREAILLRGRIYRVKNKERMSAYALKHYRENRETYLSRVRAWTEQNPERAAANKSRYKARRRGAEGDYTLQEWQLMCKYFGDVCLACGANGKLTVDHVVPLVRGGSNDILNLQPLCASCNSSKRAKIIDYRDPELLSTFLLALIEAE